LTGHLEPIDMDHVMHRVRTVIATIERGENAAAWRKRGVDVLLGETAFLSPTRLQVGTTVVEGRAYLICTGSHPIVPPIPGLQDVAYLTNETIFDLRVLPEHLIIAGGGPIGAEMAQAFRRLGAQVTLIAGDRGLLPREDRSASAVVAETFRHEGIHVSASRLASVEHVGSRLRVTTRGEGNAVIEGDQLLLALGRRPTVAALGLDRAGVGYNAHTGIRIDAYLRTTAPHIFACGDVTGPYYFTHAAGFQAAAAVRNALFPAFKGKVTLDPLPWTTFTDPEVARVGLTADAARRAGRKPLVLRAPFRHVDRALAEGRSAGFVEIVVTPWRGRILGCTIVGPAAGELLGEVTLAMTKRLSVTALAGTIHVYPTLAMAVQQAALGFYKQWPVARLASGPLRQLARRS
jgi:pyruvate/2-oxoglutarate dehydrogenase complex dihydrolipoamide dehydrogenase (E3) component